MRGEGVRRLFFALWPDEALQRRMAGLVHALAGGPDDPGGRPVHPEDLHATLVFLGRVTPEQYPCVLAAADAVAAAPFELSIDRMEHWRRSRVLWCGPHETPAALTRLFLDLRDGLKACGFPPEQRPYAPHVTLVRDGRPLAPRPIEPGLIWRPSGFVLVESLPVREPPRYRVVRSWAAQGRRL